MDLAVIGLGKMGSNMSIRLLKGGHRVVAYDKDPKVRQQMENDIPELADSLSRLIDNLPSKKIIWIMLPPGPPTEETFGSLLGLLNAGDVIIDGGNCYYKDSIRRSTVANEIGIGYLDAGISGGIAGLTDGYSIMVGGDINVFHELEPIFQCLAPRSDLGYGFVGPSGSGHFVKMIHNGIEYGLMQAYAEGFEMLISKEEFALDVSQISGIWQGGSIISSRLLDFAGRVLEQDVSLENNNGYVEDTGEGRWTVLESIDLGVPIPVITTALQRRFRSRQSQPFSDRLLAALRKAFGGHQVKSR